MTVRPAQAPALAAAVDDYNRSFARQGCSACTYRLFRMFEGSASRYDYMMTGDWPSQADYVRIHASADFRATGERNPVMAELSRTEFYGRFVEVAPGGPGRVAFGRDPNRPASRIVTPAPPSRSARAGA